MRLTCKFHRAVHNRRSNRALKVEKIIEKENCHSAEYDCLWLENREYFKYDKWIYFITRMTAFLVFAAESQFRRQLVFGAFAFDQTETALSLAGFGRLSCQRFNCRDAGSFDNDFRRIHDSGFYYGRYLFLYFFLVS